jgi:hypothetical protein
MSDKKSSTRVYVILDKETGKPVALIDCANGAQADRAFMAKKYETRYAEQADMFAAACAGIQIEKPAAAE